MSLIKIMFKKPKRAQFALNYLWPAWWFTGIKITHISDDFKQISVRMKLRFYNINYVGTQFGGNLFAMTDPFYMLMILKNVDSHFIVWDKAATIEFLSPGKSTVYAQFQITDDDLHEITQGSLQSKSYTKTFETRVVNSHQKVIAKINKTIYIRQKKIKADH